MRLRRSKSSASAAGAALALLALVVLPADGAAQDIDARTMALIHDAAGGQPPAGSTVDPAALAEARKALRDEKLLTAQRVATQEPDIVDIYGRALLLGPRARQFLPELADVRNAAIRRDREATAAAIARLLAKAGRPRVDDAQMAKFVDAVSGAGEDEGPAETARRRIEKPGRTIEITDAKRAGLFTIDVTETPSGSKAKRTVVVAERTVRPNAAGTGLEERAVPVRVCSVTEAQSSERRAALNGAWSDQNGNAWDVSGSGDSIALVERKAGTPAIVYAGTYRLGRVQATHVVGAPNEIADLPDWVRVGLVGRTSFVVRFDDCRDGKLTGTWESRHVTYSPALQTIGKIHDPYDLALNLGREAPRRMARGGRFPEDGP